MAEKLLEKYLSGRAETQHAFAARVGVSASALSSWLLGKRAPDITSAAAVERATAGAVPIASWARRDRRHRAKGKAKTPKKAS